MLFEGGDEEKEKSLKWINLYQDPFKVVYAFEISYAHKNKRRRSERGMGSSELYAYACVLSRKHILIGNIFFINTYRYDAIQIPNKQSNTEKN